MKITIVVKGCNNEFSMEVTNQEPILQIKARIQNFLGFPIDSQTLIAEDDWELIDGLDLSDYPFISDDTKINLSVEQTLITPLNNNVTTPTMKLTIKFSSRNLEIQVDGTDTVRSLKEKIHIVDGTPIKRMNLFFDGIELEDDFRGLHEYGIQENSEIVVFLKSMSRVTVDPPTRKVSLVIQTSSSLLDSAKIPMEVDDTNTVDEMRKMMLERRLIPMDDYIFIHKQRIMRDDCSLRWHGVENGDYVYVFKGSVSRGGGY